jgi:hypothetical protein
MKKTYFLLAALALTFVAGAASAFAGDAVVKANVPFDFTVSSSTLPAGDYTFSRISPNTWTIRNESTGKGQLMVTSVTAHETIPHDSGELVFKQFGSNYFLLKVRYGDGSTELSPSKLERSMERETARNGSKPEAVYVLASVR